MFSKELQSGMMPSVVNESCSQSFFVLKLAGQTAGFLQLSVENEEHDEPK